MNVQKADYWSATPFVGDASSSWFVDFVNGIVKKGSQNNFDLTWCVGSGI